MVSSTTSDGTRIRIAKNPEMLHDYYNKLEQQSHMLHGFDISLVPGKTQSKFAVSDKALSKAWRQEVSQYVDLDESITLGVPQKAAWLCQMFNCPTDDLEGVYYPLRCFESKGIPLKISYVRCDDPQPLLSHIDKAKKDVACANDQDIYGDENLHCIHISLPRCMLKCANRSFDLQHKWEERLLLLCSKYSYSFGYIVSPAQAPFIRQA